MPKYIALLRAVNVGGTGKLAMTDLQAMCDAAGFLRARTYIASGNVVFASKASAAKVKAILETCLLAHAGKPIAVMVRTAAELAAVVQANPFAESPPNRTMVVFLDRPPPSDALTHATGVNDERMHLGEREIFVHYPSGMGTSKLRIPAAKAGTGRNMNTVAKLAEMAAQL
jgi:uncharacterized protein (DUF1697 family)